MQGYKLDNTTQVSQEGTTSGHSSRRDQGDDQGPPQPSAHLPRDTVMGIHGWSMHYPNVHPLGIIGYLPSW
jgi:hypothetical protein